MRVREYPVHTMEDAIVAAVRAEREGAIAIVCAPIVSSIIGQLSMSRCNHHPPRIGPAGDRACRPEGVDLIDPRTNMRYNKGQDEGKRMRTDVVRLGRLSGERTGEMMRFLSSMRSDRCIADADVLVDIAHVLMLERQKIIETDIAKQLLPALIELNSEGVPEEVFDDRSRMSMPASNRS